jgi:hypothetical protein
LPTPTPESECAYVLNKYDATEDSSMWGKKAFSGDYRDLKCLDQIVREATGNKVDIESLRVVRGGVGGPIPHDIFFDDMVYTALGNKFGYGAQVFITDTCEPVPWGSELRNNICGDITFSYAHTPISFLWTEEVSIEGVGVVNQFSVNPGEPGYYVWRGSEDTPLLVFDPERTGRIKDGTQLFGNYTFGGKAEAGMSNISLSDRGSEFSKAVPWEDGFEALSVLDTNGDGVISGEELDALGIWFDRNQNGISEPGEVKSLREAGVTELRYRGAVTDRLGNIRLSQGFTVIRDGKEVRGELVDWHTQRFDSSEEALMSLHTRSTLASLIDPSSVISSDGALLPSSAGETEGVSDFGAKGKSGKHAFWRWEVHEEDTRNLYTSSGYFVINDEGSDIEGASFIEIPAEDKNKNVTSVVMSFPLRGKLEERGDSQEFEFSVKDVESGLVTSSVARLSADGKSMDGASFVKDNNGNMLSYRWKAEKTGVIDLDSRRKAE